MQQDLSYVPPCSGKGRRVQDCGLSQAQMLFRAEARTLPFTTGLYERSQIVIKDPSVKGVEDVCRSGMHCIKWT